MPLVLRDKRVDRALQALFAIALFGWSGLLWTRSEAIIQEQRMTRELLHDIEADVRIVVNRLDHAIADINEHRDVYAHEGAREALQVLSTSVTRLRDDVGRLRADMERALDK